MLISVILDNYNYSTYISQAIESVLSQTYTKFELIIVDDGSSDGSAEIIQSYAKKDNRIKPIFKENGGQASAFNAGFAACSGDIICFLDSDDYFAPNKIQEVVKFHHSGYEYVFTDHQAVDQSGKHIKDTLKRYKCDGHNLFLVYYMSKYPGNVTSTISLKRSLADKIFPLPNESEWKIQADDVIVFQAAMMSRAKFLDKKLTFYRIHDANGHYGQKRNSDYLYELMKKRNRLKANALNKMNLPRFFLTNPYNLLIEIKTHALFSKELALYYLKVVWFEMDITILSKILVTFQILKKLSKGSS